MGTKNRFENSESESRNFVFSEDERQCLRGSLPQLSQEKIKSFIDYVQTIIATDIELPLYQTTPSERKDVARRIESCARKLKCLFEDAGLEVISGTAFEIELRLSAVGLSIVNKSNHFKLLELIAAIEEGAKAYRSGHLVTRSESLIRNVAFAYQSSFGLRPTHAKNSVFRRALEGINDILECHRIDPIPSSVPAVERALKGFGNPHLPTARRGRKMHPSFVRKE